MGLIDKFASEDAAKLAGRILWRNFSDSLPESFSNQMNAYLRKVNPSKQADAIIDYKGERRTTPRGALAEIDQLRQSPDLEASQHELLRELEMYLQSQFPEP